MAASCRPSMPLESNVCKPKLWISIERALLLGGIALLALYGAARIEGILTSRAAVKAFDRFDRAAIARESYSGAANASSKPWDDHRVEAYKQSLAEQTSRPLALLRISKIRLKVPVFDGTDDLTLNHAVGRIAGTARPGERGNIGIAGHRDGYFRGLKDVAVGDTIELKTPKGIDLYAVEQVSIVSPTDVTALRPQPVPSLTLVTCYPFDFIGSAPKRYIVTTSLIRETRGEAGSLTPGLPSKTSNSTRRAK
jgi:sortase A